MRGGSCKGGNLVVTKRTDGTRRCANDQHSRFEDLPFGDQRTRPDQAVGADDRTVENSRAHPDQRLIADRAAVEDCLMPDRYAGADDKRSAGIGMSDCAVLDVRLFADQDRRIVGANYGFEPDAGVAPEPNIADEIGRRRGPCPLGERWCDIVKSVKRHDGTAVSPCAGARNSEGNLSASMSASTSGLGGRRLV
jgi:hypothetical protein